MHQVKCPNCGAVITFRSGESVFAVCSYCQTTMVRSDISVESIGKMAILQDAWSPLQIGTEGDFDNGHFFIVGQVQYRWSKGTWSEWYATFNDGRTGWVTEAQGFYAVTLPLTSGEDIPPLRDVTINSSVTFAKVHYQVQDIKPVQVGFATGELPFKAVALKKSTTVDLLGPNSAFASIEYRDDESQVFLGKYADFESFRFQNLRQIDGW